MTEQLRSLEDLLDLQSADFEIDRLLNERQSLDELDDFRLADERLSALQTDHDAASTTLRGTSLELDRLSGELELAEAKLDAEQNRLYAGGLSARDATFLRQEVQMLERRNSDMEDEVLEFMERRDTQQVEVERIDGLLSDVGAERDRLESVIAEAWKGIDGRIARKEVRKADIAPLVDPALMELYEELRPLKDGVAVGRLAESVCGGCHLRLSAAEQLEAAKSEPPRCLHCRRILVI